MKRKTSDTPCRIYSFRCLPPVTEQARVEDQFRLAHQYRNALVEIEHHLWGKFRDLQIADAIVGPLLLAYEEANAAVDNALDDLRMAKSGNSKADLTEHGACLDAAKEWRNTCSDLLKQSKKDRVAELTPEYEKARAWANNEKKVRRNEYIDRGLRHGAYIRQEDAVKQATQKLKHPPRFERYEGEGSIGTQLLASGRSPEGIMGLTVSELHSMQDPRLRLQPLPDTYNQMRRNHRRHAARVRCWLRVGTVPGGRAPIFAEFPVTFHRPLPKDGVIKWAYIVRYRVGYRYEWRLQLTIESETFRSPVQSVGEGTCAIDLGWRRIFDDERNLIGIRAAMVVDDTGKQEEVLLPEKVWKQIGKCDDLVQIRDKALDRIREYLYAWAKERAPAVDAGDVQEAVAELAPPVHGGDMTVEIVKSAASTDDADPVARHQEHAPPVDGGDEDIGLVPEWFIKATEHLARWKSPGKMQWLADEWSKPDNRFPGDWRVLEMLRAWAKQDRHLCVWQSSQRERLLAHRKETWRVTAARLARTYATIVFEDGRRDDGLMDLTDIEGWEQPAPEDGNPSDGREQRHISRLVASGELRECIIYAAAKNGAKIEKAASKNSTKECSHCGHVQERMDARQHIEHTCESCGVTWDQDWNACVNLLKRYAQNDDGGGRSVANG